MDLIFQIIILIMSVVIHEVSHGYAANMLGDKTAEYEGRLTLNPVKHLDFFGSFIVPLLSYTLGGFIIGWAKPVPFNPYNLRNKKWGEAIVAGAGPLSNILIALIFGFAIRLLPLSESFLLIFQAIVFINILLAIFNLVPIPPLDGSKILFSFLPFDSRARALLERSGLILVLIFIFFLWRLIFPVVVYLFNLITGLS
ncbi:MAG TPA: site-2 protease family protein [Candidatus Paceibacterota bacterium]